MSTDECTACQSTVPSWDGVWVGDGERYRFLCSRCYNESIAALIGLDYEHINFEPVSVQDLDGVMHSFVFTTHLMGDRIAIEAHEEGAQDGYEFSVVEDAEQDLFVTFGQLFERIRTELGRKHIEPEGAGYRITDGDTLRGQITDDLETADDRPLLIIDGKPVNWDELARIIAPYKGFRFKLEIFDSSEER